MHAAGYRVVYFPGAEVTHRIGVSSRTAPNRVILARHAGMWRYYRTYLRGHPAVDAVVGATILGRCALFLAQSNLRRTLVGVAGLPRVRGRSERERAQP